MPELINAEPLSDVLVERANQGDEAALNNLVERYQPLIRYWIRRLYPLLGGTGLGYDDLRQEAALAFIELVREYDPAGGVFFGAYLKSKFGWRVRNRLAWHRRRRRGEYTHEPETLDGFAARPVAARPAGPDQFQDLSKVSRPAVRQALSRLTAIQRDVIGQVYGDDYGAEELADHLDVSSRAVKRVLRRAITQLRADLCPAGALAG